MDGERQAELSKTLRQDYRSIRAVVVLHGDLPVFEYYRHGTNPDDPLPVRSVTKSVMSILVGIALGQAAFNSLDQHLGDLLPEALEPGVDPRVREISIRHLLTMSSGFNPTSIGALPPSARLWAWSLHRPMLDAPGRQFSYDNEASHLLSIVLTRAIKQDPRRFAQQHLFGPLGIENYSWLLDDEGNLQGSSGLSLTARDMAKIGSFISETADGTECSSCRRAMSPSPRSSTTTVDRPFAPRITVTFGGSADHRGRRPRTLPRAPEDS